MFNQNMMPGCNIPQPQYPQFGSMNYGAFVPSTNKRFARSLEEALSFPADLNSQNIYFDVDKDIMYDICTNGRGEKSWAIFKVSLVQNSTNSAQANTSSIEERMKTLETRLEELINGKHNAQQTNATNG